MVSDGKERKAFSSPRVEQGEGLQEHRLGYKLVRLASGDYSLHSESYRETFHPVIGPVAEAEALYLNQLRLVERLQQHEGEFVIWDVGLGSAANVLTALRGTQKVRSRLHLLSFDQTLEPLEFGFRH